MQIFRSIFTVIGALTVVAIFVWFITGHAPPDDKSPTSDATAIAAQSPQPPLPLSEASPPAPPPVATPAPPQPQANAATTASFSHSLDARTMACNDPNITAEMQDVSDHPGTLSDAAFRNLWNEGQCSPIMPEVNFTVKKLLEFQVAAGIVKMAQAEMKLTDGSTNTFYVLQNRIVMAAMPETSSGPADPGTPAPNGNNAPSPVKGCHSS